jgi:small subunit ribosomal protein S20
LPHHKSAKKRLKTSKTRRLRNRAERSLMRSAIRSFRTGVPEMSAEDKQQQLSGIYSLLDTQVRKGVINKSKAARLKSRLALHAQR